MDVCVDGCIVVRRLNPSLSIPTLIVRQVAGPSEQPAGAEAAAGQEEDPYPNPNPNHNGGRVATVAITQSLAALEYLEDAYPASDTRIGLLPAVSDTLARATVRSLVNIITTDTHPLTTARVGRTIRAKFPCPATEAAMSTGIRDWDAHWIRRGLGVYEDVIRDTAGRFSIGDRVTMADVCLVPEVWTAEKVGVVVVDEFPTVKRIVRAMEQESAVRRAHWRCQPDTPEEMRMADAQE